MGRFGLAATGFLAGLAAVILGVFLYLKFGGPPVAVADPAFPFEKNIVQVPLNARIDREMPHSSPVQATPENLRAGATIYREQCAFCHGTPGKPSAFGPHMYPNAPQLWKSHRAGVVGVSDDPAGETFWKVKNGIRLTGMPSYVDLLSEQQMWQVSMLLKTADKPLPSGVYAELTR